MVNKAVVLLVPKIPSASNVGLDILVLVSPMLVTAIPSMIAIIISATERGMCTCISCGTVCFVVHAASIPFPPT